MYSSISFLAGWILIGLLPFSFPVFGGFLPFYETRIKISRRRCTCVLLHFDKNYWRVHHITNDGKCIISFDLTDSLVSENSWIGALLAFERGNDKWKSKGEALIKNESIKKLQPLMGIWDFLPASTSAAFVYSTQINYII